MFSTEFCLTVPNHFILISGCIQHIYETKTRAAIGCIPYYMLNHKDTSACVSIMNIYLYTNSYLHTRTRHGGNRLYTLLQA